MKIVRSDIHTVPVNHRGNWVFIELETADGHKGWGEGTDSRDEAACIAEMQRIAKNLQDKDIDPLASAAELMDGVSGERLARTPPSAVAQALYDLACRAEGISLAEHLAADDSVRETVDFYCNINRMCQDREPGTVAEAGRAVVAAGCTRIKMAPFDEVSPEGLRDVGEKLIEPGVARLSALRDAIGPDIDLQIDCHWRFISEFAGSLARHCKELGISWIEDPLDKWIKADCDTLREVSGGRVCGGEDMFTYDELEELAASGCIDLMIADVKFVGGPGELDRICKMAASYGLNFAPHNPSGPICTAASAHVTAANPNAEVLEYAFGEVPWRLDFAKGERPSGNAMAVTGPGLGIEIDFERQGAPVTDEVGPTG